MDDWQAEIRGIARQRVAANHERLAQLLAEVEAEAWAEIRDILRREMVAALLAELGQASTKEQKAAPGVVAAPGDGERDHGETGVSLTPGAAQVPDCPWPQSEARTSPDPGTEQARGVRFSETTHARAEGNGRHNSSPILQADGTDKTDISIADAGRGADAGEPAPDAEATVGAGAPVAADTCWYVYGIVDATALDGLPPAGVGGRPVSLLPYRGSAAVVSQVPLADFGEEPLKAHLGDMAWLETTVRGHQAVLDAVLPLATPVPMKFATVYLSSDGVLELLAGHYDEFQELLGYLRGRGEWGLKLYCDEVRLGERIIEISPELQRLQAQIQGKSAGAAYMLARKLQQTRDEEIQRACTSVAQDTHDALAALSAATRINALQGTEITGRAERMLLNGVYLVENAELPAFQTVLEAQAAVSGENGFQFELSGPWPPYNFVFMQSDAD
jgi:hypothetical protein